MFGFAWLTLRQAQEAIKNGRLEEAQRLLAQPNARSHKRAGDLLLQLARGFVERGERQLGLDDAAGAWRDLLAAEALGTAERSTDRLRQALTGLGVAELRALLQAGETARAEEAVARLRQQGVRSPEMQVLEEVVLGWGQARDLANKGEFAAALEQAERVRRLVGVNARLDEFRADLQRKQATFGEAQGRLHEAALAGRWREVMDAAEQVLAAAPQHEEARNLRARAWRALEPGQEEVAPAPEEGEPGPGELPPRFFLWIDGVGGYLVCLGGRVTFGQAGLDARVDVPLLADVSRLHATLSRDAEGYLLEAVRPIQVNGADVTRALLQPGDRVTLGATCQFLFRTPVPGSTTARLDLVSGHRLAVAVDGVLLMADTLVLGNGPQAHVQVATLKQPVVLFRHRDGLGMRHQGELRVGGQKSAGRSLLGPNATVAGPDVAFAIEPA